MRPADDFTWGNHVLTNKELAMFNEGLEEFLNHKSREKLHKFNSYMTTRYNTYERSMSFLLEKRSK